jgi:hypothetical protein
VPDQISKSANVVLGSLHRRFVDEAYGVSGLFFESIFKTREQLANLLIGDELEELLAKSRIVHEGIYDWLEALVRLAHTYAGRLTAIITANPQLRSKDDQAQWIRLWLEERLQKGLRQGELSLEKRARQDWQKRVETAWESVPEADRRRALNFARAARESLPEEKRQRAFEDHLVRSVPTTDNTTARCSRVESWIRRVADDKWRGSPTGSGEPWLSPSWCNEELWIKVRVKKYGTCPDRLTRQQTAHLIHSFEEMFAARLEHVLSVEEDQARIILSQQPPAEQDARDDFAMQPVPPVKAKIAPTDVTIPKETWMGTGRSLADKTLEEFHAGTLPAKSALDALTQVSKRYVQKNGKPFDPRSLWQNLQNRKAEGK